MKTKLKAAQMAASVIAIAIITIGIIALPLAGCNNGDTGTPTHVHEWGEWVQTKAPTATEEGEETKTCATCGEKETRTIPKTTHTHDWGDWTVTTPAACETAGVETRTCKLDASHKETRAIAALGHDWGEWAVTTPPTTTAEGVETRTCKRDATHKETRPIAKLPDTDPHDQTATITGLCDNNSSATVKGNLTDAQWDGVADKIKTAINDRFNELSAEGKGNFKSIFNKDVTIIVEASPVGYTNWKTTGDGKTAYLSLVAVNGTNLKTLLSSALVR